MRRVDLPIAAPGDLVVGGPGGVAERLAYVSDLYELAYYQGYLDSRPKSAYDARDFGPMEMGAAGGIIAANASTLQSAVDHARTRWTTGTDLQKLLYGGAKFELPYGLYRTDPLTIDSPNMIFEGQGQGATRLESDTGDIITINTSGGSRTFNLRFHHMSITSLAGGGHVFRNDHRISNSHWHGLQLAQHNPGKSIYYHPGTGTAGGNDSWDYIDNLWTHCKLSILYNSIVPGVYIRSNAPSSNTWYRLRTEGKGARMFDIESGSGAYANDNVFSNINAEYPNSGFLRIGGARGCLFEAIGLYDLPANTVVGEDPPEAMTGVAHMFVLDETATGADSGNNTFLNVKRHGGTLEAGIYDVYIAGNAVPTNTFINCGTVSPSGFLVNLNHTRAVAIACGNVDFTNDGALVLVSDEFGIEGIKAPTGRFSKGYQADPVACAATVAGTGTALIAADTRNVVLTTPGINAIITLPVPWRGYEVTLYNASLIGYELRTTDPETIAINGGTGTNAESAIPAGTTVHCRGISSTAYVCTNIAANGTMGATEPAAP